MDALLTKDASEILKALDILKTRECGYAELVNNIFHQMNIQQEVNDKKAARKLLKCLLDNDLLILFITIISYNLLHVHDYSYL